jgi:CubicO group peptidase (beta-lactamase class C family)
MQLHSRRSFTRAAIAGALVATLGIASAPFAAELPVAKPDKVGLSPAHLARIDDAIAPYLGKQIAGGVVGVTRHGKVVWLKAYGHADLESKTPMREDSIFRIASMTKPITTVAAMMLFEDGKLLLNDPISKYVPEFKDAKVLVAREPGNPKTLYGTVPAKREPTILDLMNHTAGITYRFMGRMPLATMYDEAGVSDGLAPVDGSLATVMPKLAALPLQSQPGEAYEYGLGTDMLGYVIERVSGMPLDRFFKQRIFDPLGMKDTQFYVSDAQRARLASLYMPDGKGGIANAGTEPVTWGTLVFSGGVPTSDKRTFFSGGGGLSSTVRDYLRFTQMLLDEGSFEGRRLLSPRSVRLMHTNTIGALSVWSNFPPIAPLGIFGDKFGLGFAIRSDASQLEPGNTGEYMWAGIFNTRFWIDPKEDLAIVFMAQVIPRVPEVEAKVRGAVYQALGK